MAQGGQSCDAGEQRSGELKDAFELFSTKDKTCLMPGDLEIVLRCLGIKQNDREKLEKNLKEESGGDDNPIQFPAFELMVGDMLDSGGPQDSEILDAFKVFDREGNGYISAAELKHLLVSLPGDLDEGEIERMIQDEFVDGDGLINYQEFVRTISDRASENRVGLLYPEYISLGNVLHEDFELNYWH